MTRLDVLSDPICPWCYIGKAYLDRALESAGNPFDLRWRPFQLNPDMPAEGMDRRRYLEAKFGGADAAAGTYARIEAAATQAGLDVRFDRIGRTPNTLDAHRLIEWARAERCQTLLVAELFRRYFRDGQDISDPDVLADAAAAAGMDPTVVRRLLAGDNDRARIREEDAAARAMGVDGVPTFILGGRYVVVGAQPPELWTRLIGELEAAAAAMPRA
jgi:predicted DsbA family dithiol-disulfide isomerase